MEIIQFKTEIPNPTFIAKKGKPWFDFGDDNNLPAYFEKLLDMSPIHSSLVNTISGYISGQGFLDKESDFFKNENGTHDLDELLVLISNDIKVNGAFALNIQRTNNRKKTGAINYVDVSKVRIATPEGSGTKKTDYYYTSPEWTKIKKEGFEPKLVEGYSNNYDTASTLLYVKCDGRQNQPYAMPAYWSARNYIDLTSEIVNFHLSNIKSGASPRLIIYNNQPEPLDQEKKDSYVKNWKQFLGGTSNAGKALCIFDGDSIKIEPLSLDMSDDRFLMLDKLTSERIKNAHSVAGKGWIFGISDVGGGGGTTFASSKDSVVEFSLFQNTVVARYQKIIEKVFSKLAGEKLEIIPFKLTEEAPLDVNKDNILPSDKPEGEQPQPNTNTAA